MHSQFAGTGVALITPFKHDLSIDFEAYGRIIEHVIGEGVDYLVPLGSTGEAIMLSDEEQRQVLDFAIGVNNGRKPIMAGNFGSNNTTAIVQKITNYNFKGIKGILSSSPAYIKPSQEGIYQHYMAIANASPVPVMIYNVPGRTKSNVEWQTTIRLAENGSNFIGIKEASGDLIQATKILQHRPEGFIVSTGDDETALPFLGLGGDGIVSVIANAYPGYFTDMNRAANAGDFETARNLNLAVYDLHNWLYSEGNPVGIKSAMKALGLCDNDVRLPLCRMTEEGYSSLKKCMDTIVPYPKA